MNKELLKKTMKQMKISNQKMCELLGISRSAWYRKRNGITQFTKGEIDKIIEVIGSEAGMLIFFAEFVS